MYARAPRGDSRNYSAQSYRIDKPDTRAPPPTETETRLARRASYLPANNKLIGR